MRRKGAKKNVSLLGLNSNIFELTMLFHYCQNRLLMRKGIEGCKERDQNIGSPRMFLAWVFLLNGNLPIPWISMTTYRPAIKPFLLFPLKFSPSQIPCTWTMTSIDVFTTPAANADIWDCDVLAIFFFLITKAKRDDLQKARGPPPVQQSALEIW